MNLFFALASVAVATVLQKSCFKNSDCSPSAYCAFPIGDCGRDGSAGTCSVRPQICLQNYAPVCGCNGQTYSNACHAASAGVSVDYVGMCTVTTSCSSNTDCQNLPYPAFCLKPIGSCNARGNCTETPQVCTLQYAPVCQCDGLDAGNPCLAFANNQSIAHKGPCNTSCKTDKDCPKKNDFCMFAPGACKAPGQCTTAPDFCPQIYSPVCSCSGNDYSNACYAMAGRESVAYNGTCI